MTHVLSTNRDTTPNFGHLVSQNFVGMYDIEEALRFARFICTQILMPIVCVIGVGTNVLNIVVLLTATMRSSTSCYLCAVAVYDLLYSLTGLPLTLRTYDTLEGSGVYMHALTYLLSFGNVWSNTAAWLTCAFTIERFMAISTPFRSRNYFSIKRTKWNIAIVCFTVGVFTLPDFFERRIKTTYKKTGNSTANAGATEVRYSFENTWFSHQLHQIGWSYVTAALFVFIPLIILTIFNALLIRSVIIASRDRGHMLANSPVCREYWTSKPVTTQIARCSGRELAWRKWWLTQPFYDHSGAQNSQSSTQPLDSNEEHWQMMEPISSVSHAQKSIHSTHFDENRFNGNFPADLPNLSEVMINKPVSIKHNATWPTKMGIIRRGTQYKKKSTIHGISRASNQDKNAITITLIAVVVVFCILNIPSAVLLLVRPWFRHADVQLKIAGNISNLLLMLNSALNFFLYSLFSARFRRSFKMLLVRHCC